MQTILCKVLKPGIMVVLSVYHDFHRYEAVYTVAHCNKEFYQTEGPYIEKDFKSFQSACNYFNKICTKYNQDDSIIW